LNLLIYVLIKVTIEKEKNNCRYILIIFNIIIADEEMFYDRWIPKIVINILNFNIFKKYFILLNLLQKCNDSK